jgi:hypothetical protein
MIHWGLCWDRETHEGKCQSLPTNPRGNAGAVLHRTGRHFIRSKNLVSLGRKDNQDYGVKAPRSEDRELDGIGPCPCIDDFGLHLQETTINSGHIPALLAVVAIDRLSSGELDGVHPAQRPQTDAAC